jgi:hypothetical protein
MGSQTIGLLALKHVTKNLLSAGSPVSCKPATSYHKYSYPDMAAVRALNDDEVFNEMKKMVRNSAQCSLTVSTLH